MGTGVGIMGKHPGFGDFVAHGLSEATRQGLDTWLTSCLPPLRDRLGDGWEAFWDNAPVLRFWIGRALAGRTLAGVLRTSQDKVGRRFPLILVAEGVAVSPPVIAPDQAFFEALEAQLDCMVAGDGASSLLDGFDPALTPPPEDEAILAEGPTVWAHRSDGDLAALLAAATPVDHARAATGRSYWWTPRGRSGATVWLAQPGMPGADAMGWLLGGGDA
jgi:type VI secretion system protein ImpM